MSETFTNKEHASKYITNNSFSHIVVKYPKVSLFSSMKKNLTIVKALNHFSRLCLALSCQLIILFYSSLMLTKWPNVFLYEQGRNKSLNMLIILVILPDQFSHCRLIWKYSLLSKNLQTQRFYLHNGEGATICSLRDHCTNELSQTLSHESKSFRISPLQSSRYIKS